MDNDDRRKTMQRQVHAAEILAVIRKHAWQITSESPTAGRIKFDHLAISLFDFVLPLIEHKRCPTCRGYGKAERSSNGGRDYDDLPDCESCGGDCFVRSDPGPTSDKARYDSL